MKTKSWAIAIAGILGATAALGGFKYHQISTAMAQFATMPEPSETVEGVVVRSGQWSASTRAVGTVASIRRTDLRNELRGTVTEVGFNSGDVVTKGQVLVRLDTAEEEAELAAARAEAELARLTLERREKLASSNAGSRAELDAARAELAASRARVARLEAVIAKKTVTAPFDARLGIRDLQPGAYLSEGTVIATLEGIDTDAYVDFTFPQDVATGLQPGMTVTVSGPGIPGGKTEGRILARDAALDQASRSARFRAVLPGLGGVLLAGTFLDVTALVGAPQTALFVPLTAVRRAAYGDHVFRIVEEEGGVRRVRQQFVRLGPVVGEDVVVLDGLSVGDSIAGMGSFKLREGLAVNVAAAATQVADGAAPAVK